ncbi:hypothetical protein ACC739_37980, partial [Rhizobium ruizarguesonis]
AFIPTYQRKGIIEHDPFISLDFDCVGELISIAAERGRRTRNDMKHGCLHDHGEGDFGHLVVGLRQKFVQRRIEQTDRY